MSLNSRVSALEEGVIGTFLPSAGMEGRFGEGSYAGDVRFQLCVVLSSFPRYRGRALDARDAEFYRSVGLSSDLGDRDVLARVVEIAKTEGFNEAEIAVLKLCTRRQLAVQREADAGVEA